MTHPSLPTEGGCRCGQGRFRISAAPIITMACHCRGCQKMSASAYSLSAAIPAEGFAVTDGEPMIGGLHGATRHFFCPHCMSWMFTRPDGMDWFVNVRATLLDDASWFAPCVETYSSEMLPWAKTAAAHSYETLPPEDAWPGLAEAYAAQA